MAIDEIEAEDWGRIINCNPAFTDLGMNWKKSRGKPIKYMYESEDEYEAVGEAFERHTDDSIPIQTVNYKKGSCQIFPVETTVSELPNADDEVVGEPSDSPDIGQRRLLVHTLGNSSPRLIAIMAVLRK